MQTRDLSLEQLQNVVGGEHAREATRQDAVDGVVPSFVAEPGSVEEISELMRLASGAGAAVVPRGAGTKIHLGNPPHRAEVIVDMTRMDRVLEHAAADQVLRVQAGVKLDELQEELAASNQMLAIDPPERGATIGGVVAANASGPLRLRYGTIRDLIIGIRVVLSDGTVAKAGGKVVKNVAGYDLSKLFTGSLGTLGVIAEANFRLHPIPEVARTVTVAVEDAGGAAGAARAVASSQIVPSAVELLWDGDRREISVLLESIPGGIGAKVETARFLLRPFGEVREEEGRVLPEMEPAEVELKVNAPPAELSGVIESVTGAAERRGLEVSLRGHAASGVTFAAVSGGGEEDISDLIAELREIRSRRGGSVVLARAPVGLKRRTEVWGYAGDAFELMRRVKEKFDPPGTMSPGRFVGGI